MLSGRTVVLGVTGSIAAYKAADLASRLRKWHADVRVIMTESAAKLINPLTFRELTAQPVVVDMFAEISHWQVQHVSLAKAADILVVAPATANIIGKSASGIADDMLSATIMATRAPILLAPAMNANMYRNPIVQENIRRLLDRGFLSIGPESGHLLCGDDDIGRMTPPDQIAERIREILTAGGELNGIRVLVTAGGAREFIDPVRFIGNRSSGRMGFALACEAVRRGAAVTLIAGSIASDLQVPPGVSYVPVTSTKEMYREVLGRFESADVVIKAAAPADFRPAEACTQKIKKQGLEELVVRLIPNPDILLELGRQKKGQIVVGFAAETENVESNGLEKLRRKNADMIVANDVSQAGSGFESEDNRVTLITESGSKGLPLMPKTRLAVEILNEITKLLCQKGKLG